MLAFFKNLSLLTSFILLTACWPLEEKDKKSSNSSLLPEVNKNLSNESPVGIWMLEIDARRFESYYYTDFEDNSTDHSSEYHGYKFLNIENDSEKENSFIVNDCNSSSSDIPAILANWQLVGEILSFPIRIFHDEIPGVLISTANRQGELELINNLALSGSQSSSYEMSLSFFALDTGDPLVPDATIFQTLADIIFPKLLKTNSSIKGVKVSDELNFAQAPEINIQLETSNISSDINFDVSQLKCMSSIEKTKTTTFNNTEADLSKVIETSISFNTHLSNDTFVNIENQTQEEITSNIIKLVNNSEDNPSITTYSSNCLDNSNCQPITSIKQSSNLKTKGQLSTAAQYTTSESITETLMLSISVN